MDCKESECGCKGIRTCLICEKHKNSIPKLHKIMQETTLYTYCPKCNFCWPEENTGAEMKIPLYLGKLLVVQDFLTEDEEKSVVEAIDSLEWMPSQSGRRKQDFGPKVNFKKKKGKIGNFRGFPLFSEYIIERFQQIPDLADFRPVELCNLEYTPERGSAIQPHVDDSWIWGERLVTINLVSSTVLTLTPANNSNCKCFSKSQSIVSDVSSESTQISHGCKHSLSIPNMPLEVQQPTQSLDDLHISDHHKYNTEKKSDMCSIYRISSNNSTDRNIAVRVLLPPRSLLILAGCTRRNWYHEIKRQDITSRRLAITFRELSEDFLEGGKESELGDELLRTARKFCDFGR